MDDMKKSKGIIPFIQSGEEPKVLRTNLTVSDILNVFESINALNEPTQENPVIWWSGGVYYKNDGEHLYYQYDEDTWIEDTEGIKNFFKF